MKRGIFEATIEGAMVVEGSATLLVKVLVTVMNLENNKTNFTAHCVLVLDEWF